jgi:hypothetical protein
MKTTNFMVIGRVRARLILVTLLFLLFSGGHRAAAAQTATATVRILSADGTERFSFSVPVANAVGGLSVAVADLGTDGTPELVLGNGLGSEPRVRVYRADGSEIGSFLAYDPAMGLGVNVAACDLDGDGKREIVTTPQRGGGPHVRVFDNYGNALGVDAFTYAESMREGVNLACGDLDGDGRAEIVTLPAAGGGPHVRVWKLHGATLSMSEEFFAFDRADRRGLVGVVDDGTLHAASQLGGATDVRSYVIHSATRLIDEKTKRTDALGTTSLVAREEGLVVVTSQRASLVGDDGSVGLVDADTDSVAAAAGDIDGDGHDELVVVDAKPFVGDASDGRRIVVDLSEQRLYAYENGLLSNSFLVSTARPPWVTPVGEHRVLAKVPLVHYAGGTGADAYDLGWIPYNLRFYPHVYIHYAPWHDRFGSVMSHGCVNVNLENIRWTYDWAREGDPVIVRD